MFPPNWEYSSSYLGIHTDITIKMSLLGSLLGSILSNSFLQLLHHNIVKNKFIISLVAYSLSVRILPTLATALIHDLYLFRHN